MTPPQTLRIAAGVELATLVVLLTNLATVHWPPLSSAIGPTHGCAYLFVIVLTIRQSRATRTRAMALVPGIGGLLVLRQLAHMHQDSKPSP
ncbi:DUF3817 domain-containing protein [Amycolatopsis taiwanensis]|uniref:DUF3817 domain-containing protein n=1 Tax=Amycolatopsis taiwanensis TaxID=342230 RepID=A0A9W6R493_9PSEU|nr:DUF3817 domain-containing protein [Amycolatopsis taiwanensis]GLY68070.1 hypothetical protein Atai01_46890 [Amycolatopsis taiwanensis]